jgi:hypothetical protein
MSGVPYTFANATTTIALSNLDANFNTPVTIGNTTVGLGNTVTTLGNVTIAGATLSTTNIAGGSANAVVYLNTSNVATANASALNFNGTVFGVGSSSVPSGSAFNVSLYNGASTASGIQMAYGANGSAIASSSGGGLRFFNYTGAIGSETYTQAMTLTNSGTLVFGVSGQGIQFTNSSASTNSTLNDYETGSWTPSWSSTGATFSYGGQIARYTKIGNMVAIYGYIVNASASGTTSNGVSLSGLPFTSSNVSSFYQPISLGQLYNITWGGGFPILYIPPNSTFASFFNERNGTTETAVTASNISGGSVMFSGVYQATF